MERYFNILLFGVLLCHTGLLRLFAGLYFVYIYKYRYIIYIYVCVCVCMCVCPNLPRIIIVWAIRIFMFRHNIKHSYA